MASAKDVFSIIFGILGLIFWSFQLAPQAWKNYKRKSTDGMSPAMVLVWYVGTLPLGIYLIYEGFHEDGQGMAGLPLIFQPYLFCLFALICFSQHLLYNYAFWTSKLITLLFTFFVVLSGAISVGVYVAMDAADAAGEHWFIILVALIPPITLGLGFLPQLVTIFRERRVELSLVFVGMDIAGGVFSIMAFLMTDKSDWDYYAIASYGVVVFMQVFITVLYFIYGSKPSDEMSALKEVKVNGSKKDSVTSTGSKTVVMTDSEPVRNGRDVEKHNEFEMK
eukprot:Nk52_evm6s227 gene=Nk52_evmTU6s227